MLYILFGGMAEMGYESRRYFRERGVELVAKKHWVPEGFPLVTRFEPRSCETYDEVAACDYVYINNGMYVGFDKGQIIDAVRGRRDCLLTISPYSLDFVRIIKETYGEYVTVIGCYIDDGEIEHIASSLPGASDAEASARIDTGRRVHELLSGERALFDEIVIYGGEATPFDLEGLRRQYAHIIERTRLLEKRLNDRMYVELPYTGNKPFVFTSYSHADEREVLPTLSALQRRGCRVWYDEGIYAGDQWRVTVASKVESCSRFLLFSSEKSTGSRHVQAEINAALTCGCKIITVRLDHARFSLHHEMYLGNYECLSTGDPSLVDKVVAVCGDCVAG